MAETNDPRDRRASKRMAEMFYDGFYRCPTTGRIIEALIGDDKVLCPCGQSNRRVPQEATARTGVHIRRFLAEATIDEWLDQLEQDRTRR
jgi:hypothetical protein